MPSQQILRYLATGILFAGLLGLALSYSDAAVGPMTSDGLFLAGICLVAIGLVVLADLGRRAREAASEGDTDAQ